MIYHRTLDYIFSSYSSIVVLRALQHISKGLTGREISRNAGITPRSALNALTNLENFKIVNRIIGGRDHIFTLNRNHYLVKHGILPLLESELNFLPAILTVIKKKLSKKTESIILFGSVARKQEEVQSDLDICLVISDKSLEKEVEKIKSELFNVISESYGSTPAFIVFTRKEFRSRGLKNKPPVNNIIKEGVVVSGKSIKLLLYGS
jgi:predicted nucleotidyltransferase